MTRLLPLAVALALAAPASGAAPGAGAFVTSLYRTQIAGEHGEVWASLHPAQQRFIPRKRFVACETARFRGLDLKLRKIVVVRTRAEHVRIGGTAARTSATAVTVRLTVLLGGRSTTESLTSHATSVAGAWRWILDRPSALAYKAGVCPE
jgi:hypothetical protein